MAMWSVLFLGLVVLLNGINGMFHDEGLNAGTVRLAFCPIFH